MPRTIVSSGTPDDPCSTSGTGTARARRATSSRSIAATRSVIACDEPTATARAPTPVSATKRAASSGSVRTPGAWAPSLPPISPSSASTSTPRRPPARRPAGSSRRSRRSRASRRRTSPSRSRGRWPGARARGPRRGRGARRRGADDASATASVARAIGSKPAVVADAVLGELEDDRAGPRPRRRRRAPRPSRGARR